MSLIARLRLSAFVDCSRHSAKKMADARNAKTAGREERAIGSFIGGVAQLVRASES